MKPKLMAFKHCTFYKIEFISKVPLRANFLTLLFILLFPILSFSQSLKTHNGPFKGNMDEEGKATYSYYDDSQTQERIKEGAFRYSASLKDDMLGSFSKVIAGNFKKGLKHGLWTYTITYKDFQRSVLKNDAAFHYNATGTIVLKANYKNGMPDGQWTYTAAMKERDKYRYRNSITYSPYKDLSSTSITLNFRNNILVGQVLAKVKGLDVAGQFDAAGSMDGKWHIASNDYEDNIEYAKGCVTRIIKRKLPSGQLIENYTEPKEAKAIRENLNPKTVSLDSVKALGFELLISNCFTSDFGFVIDLLTDNYDFLHSEIGGDGSLSIDSYKSITDNKQGGYYFLLKAIEYFNLKESDDFTKAEDYYSKGEYAQALGLYRSLSTKLLRPSDGKMVGMKLAFCDSVVTLSNKRARFSYLENGFKYYSSLKEEATRGYLRDTAKWYFTKWVQQPNGTKEPVRTLHEVLKLHANGVEILVTRFAELEMAVYKKAVESIDYSQPEKDIAARFDHLADYEAPYIKFGEPVKNLFEEEWDMLEAVKKEHTSTSLIADIQFRNPVLGRAYLNCRAVMFQQLEHAASLQELESCIAKLQKIIAFVRYSQDTPEIVSQLSSADGLKLCELLEVKK